MFDYHKFKQKSPQQRFLFVLGLTMMLIYVFISIIILFFNELLHLDPEKFPRPYQYAFAGLLIVYALIRFFRILKDK
jgi:uncharacterized membrane protein (DUF485 family)